MLCASFTEDPGVEFVVDSPLTLRDNHTVKEMVNKILSKIVKRAFIETWVAPQWRNFYLPLLQPPAELVNLRSTGTLPPVPSRPVKPETTDEQSVLKISRLTRESNIIPLGNNLDCLKDVFLPSDIILKDKVIPGFKSELITHFRSYVKEGPNWRTLSNKGGILTQKIKTIMSDANISEVTKCIFTVPIEPHLVFFVCRFFKQLDL